MIVGMNCRLEKEQGATAIPEQEAGDHNEPAGRWPGELQVCLCYLAPTEGQKDQAGQGADVTGKMFRPEPIKAQHVPGKGDKKMDPVGPFDLRGIEQQMEQAVEAEQQKDLPGSAGRERQGSGQEQAEEEAGLIQAVEPQSIRVDARRKFQQPLHDPGDIGKHTAQQHPLRGGPFVKQAVQRPLNADMGECVGHMSLYGVDGMKQREYLPGFFATKC